MLDKAAKDYGITEQGKAWLIEAIDPYHDEDCDPAGFPDTNMAASVMQVVKQSFNISAPSGVTANWDCNVYNLPHTLPLYYSSGGAITPCTYSLASNSVDFQNSGGTSGGSVAGGVVAVYGDPTGPSFLNLGGLTLAAYACRDIAETTDGMQYSALNAPSYYGGNSRVVAMGFEVVNTTAEIYKQGLVCAYRQPVSRDNALSVNCVPISSPASAASVTTHLVSDAPGSLQDAMLLHGSRQWDAAEGGYCTCTLNGLSNPPGPAMPQAYFLTTTAFGGASVDGSIGMQFNGTSMSYPRADSPRFNMSGLYFAGLSKETTLTVNTVYYVERFPDKADKTLVVLTKNPPGYDAVALEMYSRCLMAMPPGVPQWENGLGDWFKDVVASIPKIARTVAPVLGALPIPMAQAASGLASAIGQIGNGTAPGKTYSPRPPPENRSRTKDQMVARKKKKKVNRNRRVTGA